MWRDTPTTYGLISRLMHWLIASLMLIQFILIWTKRLAFAKDDPNARLLIQNFHKPIGVLVGILGSFFIVWRMCQPKPKPLHKQALWERLLSHITHLGLFAAMLYMPISGILMSAHQGRAIPFFIGEFSLDALTHRVPWGWSLHSVGAGLLLTFVIAHCLGVIKHQFFYRDRTLKRMWFFNT